jgi:hypothetical protein
MINKETHARFGPDRRPIAWAIMFSINSLHRRLGRTAHSKPKPPGQHKTDLERGGEVTLAAKRRGMETKDE